MDINGSICIGGSSSIGSDGDVDIGVDGIVGFSKMLSFMLNFFFSL